MINALPSSLALLMLSGILVLSGCSAPEPKTAAPEETPVADAISSIASALAAPTGEQTAPAATAEIMDIVQGSGGDWAVAVRLGDGAGPSIVEITDGRAGKLISRETVQPSGTGKVQEVQFNYRGSRDNLTVRVTDEKSGDTLADWSR